MKKFFSFIIKQSVAIVLIVVFVLAFGIYSTLNMSVNLLPDINVPMVCVQVIYPGANAQSVEDDVTEELDSRSIMARTPPPKRRIYRTSFPRSVCPKA